MAKIPSGEGFGEVVARPVRYNETQVSRGAFGEQMAGAVEQVGSELVTQERRLAAQEAAQAKAAREAADRAQAAIELQGAETDLDLIADEVAEGVRTGQIDKAKATEEFNRRSQERVKTSLPNIPQAHAALAQAALNGRTGRLGRAVGKAVTQRDQADVRSGINQQLEYAQRLYLKDPVAADKMVADTIAAIGPFSGMDPADLQKTQQTWRENTRLNKAQTLLTAARRDNKALSEVEKALGGDEFADLDPGRKATLLGQIEGFKVANLQRAEAEARRRDADQERYLRRAEAEFNAAQSIISQGKTLSPEYVEQVTRATAGTPYARALNETLRQAPERAMFGVQPLSVQRDALMQARAQLNTQGTNPALEKKVAELEKVHAAAVKDYAAEPLQAALERGVIQAIEPINTQSMAGLVQTIGKRVEQAAITQQQTGAPVSPLLSQEADQVGRMINILPIEQRASALAQVSQALGPQQAAALARQIAPKDKALGIALGMAGAKTSAGRYTSELVLRGAQAMKDKSVKPDNAAVTGIRARVTEEIGDAYTNQELRETMIEAAVLAEYGLQSEGSGDIGRAVRLATGGIAERGGRKVPLPYGVDAKTFDKRLRALTPAEIKTDQVLVGGKPMSSTDFLRQMGNAPLVHAGQGRYAVEAAGGLVQRPDGKPLIVEIR
jgi:hypothetical protein